MSGNSPQGVSRSSRRSFVASLGLVLASRSEATTPEIQRVLAGPGSADDRLRMLMPALVRALGTDRCFIYMRDPRRRRTAYTHGHSTMPDWPSRAGGGWRPEPNPTTLNEPMLKKAFTDPAAQFIEDVETAGPEVVNLRIEREVFGHRSLVHAPLHHAGLFYGVLETAMRRVPRHWSPADRAIIVAIQPAMARLAAEFLGHA